MWNAYLVGVRAESRQHHDPLADESAIDAVTHAVDDAGGFVADDAGNFRRVGIKPLARHHLGEVHPACSGANPHLARLWNQVGRLANFQDFGPAGLGDPHCAHQRFLRRRKLGE